jgi:hypothetical protein
MVTFTEDEYDAIRAKMAAAQTNNFAAFAREMLLAGEVRHYDFHELKELTSQLSHLAGSINQIAKRCNETHSVYESDVKAIRQGYMDAKALMQEQLVKLLRRL